MSMVVMKKMLSKIKCLLVFLKEGTSSRVGGGSVRIQARDSKDRAEGTA